MRPDDLLVMNDTRVIKARLFGHKDTGGKLELLVERVISEFEALAFIRASHAPKPGSQIRLADDTVIDVLARQDDLTLLRFPRPVLGVLDQTRPVAAAALYRAHPYVGGRGALSNRVCKRARLGGGADRRAAF